MKKEKACTTEVKERRIVKIKSLLYFYLPNICSNFNENRIKKIGKGIKSGIEKRVIFLVRPDKCLTTYIHIYR